MTRTAKPTLRPNENIVDVHYKVLVKQNRNGMVADIEETHSMRYLFLPEVRLMLQSAGMELLQAERWMSQEELGCGSWQAVVIAQRK